jgi:hypothetical protein
MKGSIWTDHAPLLVLLATLLAAFLALLWKDEPSDRWRLFARVWLWLVGGSLAAAWLMYPFPGR